MTATDAFGKEVAAACTTLIEKFCFRLVDQQSEPSFGNALVVLESDKLRVRIVRDRGRVRLEIASSQDPDRWFDFDIVMLRIRPVAEGTISTADSSTMSATWISELARNYHEIAKLFSRETFPRARATLEALEWDRARRLFGAAADGRSSE